MSFTKQALGLFALGAWAVCALGSDPQLARDVDALRNSLPLQDPARPTLTLRLADVLFDQAVEIGSNPLIGDEEKKQLLSYRKRTLALYQEALKGTQFHPPASGALAYKIKFQLARLYQDLGEISTANVYWRELVAQQELRDLRREAALRLAEFYEKQRTMSALKESETYYRLAIELCGEGDVCAYGHYRLAWALREAGNLKGAIEQMQVALFDSKGQPRDEALRDLIVFLAAEKTDGQSALLLVEKLAQRVGRPSLFEDLAEAFFSAGNRVAGTRALEHVNQRTPTLSHQIRLMEEFYGLRQWDKFRIVLDQAARSPVPQGGVDTKTEKIIRRLSVQLDGERVTKAEHAEDFQSVVLLYMQLFPKHPDQFKMIEGWLAAETDAQAKMKKIDEWVNGADLGLAKADQIKLRETRLALAVKGKDSAIIELEAGKLAELVSDQARVREYRYVQSVSIKEQGRVDDALKLLNTWALPNAVQDVWTFRGGLLTVDILVEKKLYSEIAKVSGQWVESPQVASSAKVAKERKIWDEGLAHLAKLREEARFEAAVVLGEKPEALTVFEQYCLAGKFLPKSCENGRVLAVKLKNQKAILSLLKATNRMGELAAEYEAAGFFAEAAELTEKDLGEKSEDAAYLKVALLYELGSRFTDRNRLLAEVARRMKARKAAGEQEEVIFATFKDARMLGPEALDLPWSEANRLRLANQLELEGKGSERTRKELLASTRAAGMAWSRFVLEELAKLDVAQRKISFYGRQGQVKFKSRLSSIGALDTAAEKYFGGADVKTRARIALLVGKGYSDFAKEILASPTPAELSPELLAEVKASLSAMAEPFEKKAAEYQKLAKEQLVEIPLAERAAFEALLLPDADTAVIAKVEYPAPVAAVAAVSEEPLKRALSVLHDDPSSSKALTEIKGFYESQGKQRLASYFQGRLLQLNGGSKQ